MGTAVGLVAAGISCGACATGTATGSAGVGAGISGGVACIGTLPHQGCSVGVGDAAACPEITLGAGADHCPAGVSMGCSASDVEEAKSDSWAIAESAPGCNGTKPCE